MVDLSELLKHLGGVLGMASGDDGGAPPASGSPGLLPPPVPASSDAAPPASPAVQGVLSALSAPSGSTPLDRIMAPLPAAPDPGGAPSASLPSIPDSLAPSIMPAPLAPSKPAGDHLGSDRLMALIAGGPAAYARQVQAQHMQQRVAGVIKQSFTNGQFDPDLYIQNAAGAGLPVSPGDINMLQAAATQAAARRAKARIDAAPGHLITDENGNQIVYNPESFTLGQGQDRYQGTQRLASVAPAPVTLSQGQSSIDPATGRVIASLTPAPIPLPRDNKLFSVTPGRPGTGAPPTGQWSDFDQRFLAPHEGGYTASDGNGAPANFGINSKANPDVNVAALTPQTAQQILHDRYWVPSGADKLPPGLAEIQGDTAINMGVGAAQKLLAASGGDPQKYLDLREQRYRAIAAADPSKVASLPTWLQRNADLRAYVSGTAGHPGAASATEIASNDTPAYHILTPQEAAANHLDPVNTYQADADGKITLAGPARKLSAGEQKHLSDIQNQAAQIDQLSKLAGQYTGLNKGTGTGGYHALTAPIESTVNPQMAQMEALSKQMIPLQRQVGSGPIRMGEISGPGGGIWGGDIPRAAYPSAANEALAKGWADRAQDLRNHAAFLESWAQNKGTLLGGEEAFQAWKAKAQPHGHANGAPEAPAHGGDPSKMTDAELKAQLGLN